MSYRDQVALWREKVKRYQDPHYAQASTPLKQEYISHDSYGPWMSMVFERGTRVYVFEGQANRDRFVNKYRHTHEAKPCKAPTKEADNGNV